VTGHRVRRRRVKGWRKPPNTIIVDRTSRWGNPFKVDDYGRNEAIRRYREWIITQPDLMRRIHDGALTGHNLACTCRAREACHADVLIDLANQPDRYTAFK
jgi:hypothetical protein